MNAFDYVFWFGDFNYRVEMEREKVVECLDNSDCMVGVGRAAVVLIR